ncbi:hypothetical protein LO80_02245 [Candidatus Francisella endociliophora]|uniref:DUF218 domain-containing protein n=2 Tax=Candidatus Francisella endociliophora TaxID=653937 RepID=A0A097EMY0_9GAMM|nr:hypothetical protein LO80_02245 [Francisella sp. FSC1006]
MILSIRNFFITILFTCFVISSAFSTNKNTPDYSTINLKQKAIENVQYSIMNESSADKYLNKAVTALKLAIKQLDPESRELLQLGLSLFSLQVDIKDYKQAGQTLDMLTESFPDNPIVQIYDTAYSYIFDFSNYRKSLRELKESAWAEMPIYINAFNIIDRSFHLHINMDVDELELERSTNPAIIILGSPLDDDGTMPEALIKKLQTGLKAYKHYPNSKIIVSGGRVKSGTTESYKMKQWLIDNKIPADQVILEDLSSNLVWQTMNTFNILKKLKPAISDIIIIDSASNIRRANAVFKQESFDNNMLDMKIHNLATSVKGYNIVYPLEDYEKVMIIKDTLRAAGIWLMPGMVF